jgi:hypothetical protein
VDEPRVAHVDAKLVGHAGEKVLGRLVHSDRQDKVKILRDIFR